MNTGDILESVMQTGYWASALLINISISSLAQQAVPLASGRAITYSSSGADTILSIPMPGGRTSRLRIERDAAVAEGTKPASVKLIAEIPGSVLILTDTYPSLPGGMSYCQTGEERFLRIIAVSGKKPVETYHVKIESCRDNVELRSPGLKWSAETKSLDIHWLSAPGGLGKPKDLTIRIGADGKPVS